MQKKEQQLSEDEIRRLVGTVLIPFHTVLHSIPSLSPFHSTLPFQVCIPFHFGSYCISFQIPFTLGCIPFQVGLNSIPLWVVFHSKSVCIPSHCGLYSIPSMSPFHSLYLSLFHSSERLKLIDTTLLKCYIKVTMATVKNMLTILPTRRLAMLCWGHWFVSLTTTWM